MGRRPRRSNRDTPPSYAPRFGDRCAAIRGEFPELKSSGAVRLYHEFRDAAQINDLASAEIVDLTICGGACRREKKRVHRILDIGEVAELFAAPDRNRLSF